MGRRKRERTEWAVSTVRAGHSTIIVIIARSASYMDSIPSYRSEGDMLVECWGHAE